MTNLLVITSRETNFNKCLCTLYIGLLDYYERNLHNLLGQDNLQYQMEDKVLIVCFEFVDSGGLYNQLL